MTKYAQRIPDNVCFAVLLIGCMLAQTVSAGGLVMVEAVEFQPLAAATRRLVSARVAALLDETSNPELRDRALDQKPYWHVELIVNGQSVDQQEITANGSIVPVAFNFSIERSSWIALRIFPSSHTNPIFVIVDEQPIHASRRSASWCAEAIEVCWEQKVDRIRKEERTAARNAYDVARETYRSIENTSNIEQLRTGQNYSWM
jgi:hypothetical protein